MAIGWFLVPYQATTGSVGPGSARQCAMNNFNGAILADSGAWSESECLGNHAVVKVRASAATLTTIAGEPGFTRIPKAVLTDPLSDLTAGQRNAIRNKLNELGYPLSEIDADLSADLRTKTLADVLRFACKRRLKARYDRVNEVIVLDGSVETCKSIETLDGEVT